MLVVVLFILIFTPLSQSSDSLLPTYNSSTHCHHLTLSDENLTFALCLQRASDKQYPFNFYTSSSFCSKSYPPDGHLVDLLSLSSSTVDLLFQSLANLLKSNDPNIDLPEPKFFWINSNLTQTLTNNKFRCPNQCQGKNDSDKFLILKTLCQYNNDSKPCITTKNTHWNRAPFICLTRQIINSEKQISSEPIHVSPTYSNETIMFYDSTSCIIVRTRTHQYTFCIRRQSCPESKTHTYCTSRIDAQRICQEEKNGSNLLTIENDDEFQLITDVLSRYSNESVLINSGDYADQNALRAQWLWIDGRKGFDNIYRWNINNRFSTAIPDKYWCDGKANCPGGKGRDHVVLSINCQADIEIFQACLASRLQSNPGPYICKRTLQKNEESVLNYTYLRDLIMSPTTTPIPISTTPIPTATTSTPTTTIPIPTTATPVSTTRTSITTTTKPIATKTKSITTTTKLITTTTTPIPIVPVYEKNFTSIYYDEHHCLTVQTRSHLYSFCLRRQNCIARKAYCTKWSLARKDCTVLKNQAQLLTIENKQERTLVTHIMKHYLNETRLTFNGSSYLYYHLADFIWIDGVRQADKKTYLWNNERDSIPKHLWCPKNECNSNKHERVMLNVLCKKNNSLLCLGTRIEWHPAPYVCKRVRSKDKCPILFDKIRNIESNEMLIVTINRTVVFITCKHPEYNTEIKVQYECDIKTNQWKLIYENVNFICPNYDVPSTPASIIEIQSSQTIHSSTSYPASNNLSYPIRNISSYTTSNTLSYSIQSTLGPIKENDCSQSELSSIILRLPTESRNIYSQKLVSYSSSSYDMRLTCYFNHSIQITYRCNLLNKQWIYVHGNINRFQKCYQTCSNNERHELLNKYFTQYQQAKIRTIYIPERNSLRVSCLNRAIKRRIAIRYKCGTMTITTRQWYRLYSCFQSTIETELPTVTISLSINQVAPPCPPAVARGSPCEYQIGQYILDANGCRRKICPSLSKLCNTIRCPSDRVCRVIACQSCLNTNYLQPVCEYPIKTPLCELQSQLILSNDFVSIDRWERETIALIHLYSNEQRQRVTSKLNYV
ncbi:unnamed protein product [Rotaria sp. Silwood2]|nr:unnamed protein product [Rotaria sp. Silwood2]CAF4221379.1 unnamed protein product [Rotaria sp. Silwood2]